MLLSKKIGVVESFISSNEDIDDIRVNINGKIEKAYNYKKISGNLNIGDEVLLNTTAVELSLGTGGYHFVIANLNNLESNFTEDGHIMKLRYTPLQIKVNSVEEQDSIYHKKINEFKSLENLPVVVGGLHSMLTPFVSSYKKDNMNKNVIYIMTEGASLFLPLSKTVEELKEKKLIDNTITIGNSFGGDFECINIYTALITAKEILNADVVFISMGPGIAGTGTKYGFTGIEQGYILDSVKKLGGQPIFIPRISFEDKRERHNGISHHSITILDEIVNTKVDVIFSNYEKDKLEIIKNQIEKYSIDKKHNIIYINDNLCEKNLEYFDLKVKTMGRNYKQDKEFFDTASASACYVREEFEVCLRNKP
ncbi:MAG: DUF3866 family protein [Peptostreptococcaceae bacterium]